MRSQVPSNFVDGFHVMTFFIENVVLRKDIWWNTSHLPVNYFYNELSKNVERYIFQSAKISFKPLKNQTDEVYLLHLFNEMQFHYGRPANLGLAKKF